MSKKASDLSKQQGANKALRPPKGFPNLGRRYVLAYAPYTYLADGTEADVGENFSVGISAGSSVRFTTSFPSIQPFFQQFPDVPRASIKIERWTVTIQCVTNPSTAPVGVIDNTNGEFYATQARKGIGRFSVNPARPKSGEFLLGFDYLTPIAVPTSWMGLTFTFVNAAPGDELSWDATGFGFCNLSIVKGKVTLIW